MGNDVVVKQAGELTETNEQVVARVAARVRMVNAIFKEIMVKDSDFGLVSGCGDKPALLKPGSEKLLMAFRVAPQLKIEQTDLSGGHREIRVITTLCGPDGSMLGEGVGSCSTMESKYRYRNVADYTVQDCEIPQDSKERKAEYRAKGFGMKKVDGVWRWVKYGDDKRTENPDIADTYNTVLKMAKKRSIIDAVLTVFAASDIFTQDVDENLPSAPSAPSVPEKQPDAPSSSYKDTVLSLKKRAQAKGYGDEFNLVMDTYLMDKVGKAFEDLNEAEAKGLADHVTLYFANKKAAEKDAK